MFLAGPLLQLFSASHLLDEESRQRIIMNQVRMCQCLSLLPQRSNQNTRADAGVKLGPFFSLICSGFVVVVVVVVCLVLVTVAVQQEGSRDRCHWLSLRLLKNP